MEHIKLNKELYLIEQKIEKQEEKTLEPMPVNHIWIYDRSWSMSYELKKLTEDLILKSKEIPVGDTITLGWFSGEGQFEFILQGFKVTEDRDYKALEDIISKNNRPVSCTCFSEILGDTKRVIGHLTSISTYFSIMFFTDGYPVVSNYAKEIENISKAIKEIEGDVTASCLIGYGNYYNKELMMDMASKFGGSLIHNENLSQFGITLSDFIKESASSEKKMKIKIENEGQVFGIKGKSITLYSQNDEGMINFTPSKNNNKDYIYVISDTLNCNSQEVDLTGDLRDEDERFIKAIYASSYILTQMAKTDKAVDALAYLGDKKLIDIVCNSYTNAEYGNAEQMIKVAMLLKAKRFESGRDTNYLPAEDAFCILDFVDMLMKDENSYFYPYHKEFSYKKIGVPSKPREGYPKFIPVDNLKCPFSGLAWHKSYLNLSVRAFIPGSINFNGDYKKLGFDETFDTFIYRNYSIVKDGFLNTKILPISASNETIKKLKGYGIIDTNATTPEQIHIAHLDRIPVINRIIASKNTSATDLCKKVFKELEYKGILKTLKYLKSDIAPDDVDMKSAFDGLSDEQIKFLEDNGITKNGFNPPVDKEEPIDYYHAKAFEIKIKKYSSLPKVQDIIGKVESNGKLTGTGELIKEGLDMYNTSPVIDESDDSKIQWLNDTISKTNKEMIEVRSEIQKTKFAIILAKKWFDEFQSRDDKELVVDEKTFVFEVSEKIIYF